MVPTYKRFFVDACQTLVVGNKGKFYSFSHARGRVLFPQKRIQRRQTKRPSVIWCAINVQTPIDFAKSKNKTIIITGTVGVRNKKR